MQTFDREYQRLNSQQRQVVDNIDGPMMVIAGPGSGKTQILTLRIAKILASGEVNPQNILCLTFTDAAASNMHRRLYQIIGRQAYRVNISTFHSFGVEIIRRFSDFFTHRSLLNQTDQLGIYTKLNSLMDKLDSYDRLSTKLDNRYIYILDILKIISWLKQNGLSPNEFKRILKVNNDIVQKLNPTVAEIFAEPVKSANIANYQMLATKMATLPQKSALGFSSFLLKPLNQLREAIENIDTNKNFAPSITAWRNDWCAKTADGTFQLKDGQTLFTKLQTVAKLFQQLNNELRRIGNFDFDDMVVEAVHALENNPEILYELQEQFHYILVDEFQDTNKAQLRIIKALGQNPVWRGRPNIMVVGDDDQAIYAFQGADSSNMSAFYNLFTSPKIMDLIINYRSSSQITNFCNNIASLLSDRISQKQNTSYLSRKQNSKSAIKYLVFTSELEQYHKIARNIKDSLNNGQNAGSIAVIAPKHRYLERIVPFLIDQSIPVAYERRENILQSPIVRQIKTCLELIYIISRGDYRAADSLMVEILSYQFWQLPSTDIVKMSLAVKKAKQSWLEYGLLHSSSQIREICHWFFELSRKATTEPLEYMFDAIIGPEKLATKNKKPIIFSSPLRQYFFNPQIRRHDSHQYLTFLSQLISLRQHVRQWQPNRKLFLVDFLNFYDDHMQSDIPIVDNNPVVQKADAVQVMTAHKAKGLEFETVYIINALENIWGGSSRQRGDLIKLPHNFELWSGDGNLNDKIRLFYVAASRAKTNLIISSYAQEEDGRQSDQLSFLESTNLQPKLVKNAKMIDSQTKNINILQTDWRYRFHKIVADQPTIFGPIIENYQLSATHLNNFTDIVNYGPQYFLVHNLLKFPQSMTTSAVFGDALHKTWQQISKFQRLNNRLPSTKWAIDKYKNLIISKPLRQDDYIKLIKRGRRAIIINLKNRPSQFKSNQIIELDFKFQGSYLGNCLLSGKIDKIIPQSDKKVEVVDLKSGKVLKSWNDSQIYNQIKLHKFKQQLLFYKILIENSALYGENVQVNCGRIQFLEPDTNLQLAEDLVFQFQPTEVLRFKRLINSVWLAINKLDFETKTEYPKNLKGILTFENDLLAEYP